MAKNRNFPAIRLGGVCSKIGSGATPRGGSQVYQDSGIALIRSQNVYNNRFERDDLAYIDESRAHKLDNVVVESGDILLNITGASVARVCQVPDEVLPARVNQHVAIIRPNQVALDPKFLKYYLLSPSMQTHMQKLAAAGATRQALTKGMIEDFEILAPSPGTQKRIALLLGTLDDKIELNRRMNATLEAIARAIFKSWFVDFDPVRANLALSDAEGRGELDLSLPPDLLALFPDAFVESELGEIPAGWKTGTLKDCCQRVRNGGTPKKSEPRYWNPATIPWLTSSEVRQSIIVDTEDYISKEGLENSSANLWPSGTTVVALYGATAGQVCLTAKELCANQACCGLVPKRNLQFYIYLHALRSVELLGRQARGSAQQNLSQRIVSDLHTIIPDFRVLTSFHNIVQPLFERWVSNLQESRTLAELRDTLLPKLISGELRVPGAIIRQD